MKSSKTSFLLPLALLFGAALPVCAQQALPEIVVQSARYKYLNSVDGKELAQPVKRLESKAAEFDVRNSEFYEEDHDTYFISFYLPEGTLLATYDSSGKLMQTAEKYKNIALPSPVSMAVSSRYPNWTIAKDVYLVNYVADQGAGKVYKLKLQNGNKRMKVRVNDKGEFL
ncbi:MAG: nicotinate-nucleotide adenylyltransferase [Chitinophagaceae bacterium]|nr:MAG: nicotinate-nucleotide adenylyltransferase [Chitinophagaceae bacterium]